MSNLASTGVAVSATTGASPRTASAWASPRSMSSAPIRSLAAQPDRPRRCAARQRLLGTAAALDNVAAELRARRTARAAAPDRAASAPDLGGFYREVIAADVRSRLPTAASTTRPFAERLELFWANHFTVSMAKGSVRGLVGAFERDAIRPNIAGNVRNAAVGRDHPSGDAALPRQHAVGRAALARRRARSQAARARRDEGPRVSGLNENLAREVLELHTLGADSARGPRPATRRPT